VAEWQSGRLGVDVREAAAGGGKAAKLKAANLEEVTEWQSGKVGGWALLFGRPRREGKAQSSKPAKQQIRKGGWKRWQSGGVAKWAAGR
jgi:hypothetical protein